MDGEGGRSMSSLSPNWRTKVLSNKDSTLNLKDTSGSNLRIKLMQAASRLGGLMTEFSETDANGFQPCDRNVALLPGNLEHTPAIPQVDLKRRVEHLYGRRWEVPICSVIQNGNDWRDPVYTLFQTSNRTTCTPVENHAVGGSCTLATQFNESDATSRRFYIKDSAGPDRAVKENVLLITASKSSENVTRRLPSIQDYYQENLFRDMGFSLALIERAILLHGVEADVSVILQFLLDQRENNDFLGAKIREQADCTDIMLPSKEFQSTEESVSAVLRVRQHVANSTKKKEDGQPLGSEDSDSSNNDFDDDEEGATPLKPGSPIDWTAEKGPDYLVSLCKRELPTGEGHRHLISSLGFAAELVDRAIQELGEGVDYEMLLEYLLYRTSQQDPTASSPQASRVKRASTAKKPSKEWAFPNKRQVNYKKQVCTVEKLVDECGYPAKSVERAVIICGAPLCKAEEDQVADVVDFLAAHVAELNGSEDKAHIDEDPQEDTDCSWLRQLFEENESTGGRGKRKVDSVGVSRRQSIVRLSSQSKVKREHFDQLPLSSIQLASTMPRVKLGPSQQRFTPVCRIGRPQKLSMGVSVTVARHEGSVGFGLPGNPVQPRYLEKDVVDAPFFYFENVASMPNDEWERIRRHLFDIEPEFVDSLHFSACRRPRGYIHNLPINGRRKILAEPPMTIQDLLPHTKPFWPAWDPRTKLNCITTRMGSEFLIKKLHIREGTALQTAEPSPEQQREILHLCRHWNLVWTSPNIPTPIDEIEIEAMLGFDAGHSRNILSNRSRYKALGNSFSVHTVAFHFSVLKPLYPHGVKVLSLFSGIGGAEVALHKMGIKLLVVVSVEIDDGTRRCLEAWWATSKQTGVLNQNYHNIKDLGRAQISELVNTYGGFDLIVGGTPCNNLSGSNHVTRVGLDGKQSTIFFEFSRVVTAVRDLTIRLQRKI